LGFSSLSAVVVNEVSNKVYLGNPQTKSVFLVDGVTNELSYRALQFEPCSVVVNTAANRVYVSHCSDGLISIIAE
jgi:DNA-binding beta-propeller fold protein YncE